MVTKVSDTVGPTLYLEAFEQDTGTTTGLTFGYKTGDVLKNTVLTTIAAGTVTLSATSNNVVYIDFTNTPPTVEAAVLGTQDPLTSIVLFQVNTDIGTISRVIDLRNWTMGRTVEA